MSELALAIERLRAAPVGDLGPLPLPIAGLEAVVAGAVTALGRGDWWVPGLRERAGAVLRDVPLDRLAEGARSYRIALPGGSPALRALYAVGLAAADRDRCVLVHLGVGSCADGAFHEALGLAAQLRASVVFVVAVHPLDGDAPLGPQIQARPAAIAAAFGLATTTVDGASARDVHTAVASARQARGPHLIEARLTPGTDVLARARAEA